MQIWLEFQSYFWVEVVESLNHSLSFIYDPLLRATLNWLFTRLKFWLRKVLLHRTGFKTNSCCWVLFACLFCVCVCACVFPLFITAMSVFFSSRLSDQCTTSWLTELSAKADYDRGSVGWAFLGLSCWSLSFPSFSLSFFCFIRYFGIIKIKYYLWPLTRSGLKHFKIPNFTT